MLHSPVACFDVKYSIFSKNHSYFNNGHFKLGQTEKFSCEVDPPQSDPVTYQWWKVEDVGSSIIYFSVSFYRTY